MQVIILWIIWFLGDLILPKIEDNNDKDNRKQ